MPMPAISFDLLPDIPGLLLFSSSLATLVFSEYILGRKYEHSK